MGRGLDDTAILRICGKDIEGMTRQLLETADLAGLLLKKAKALKMADSSGLRIAVKPNLVTPSPADFGATTHKEIVEALIRYLQAAGFSDITVMEGSWVGDSTKEAFELLGYRKLADRLGVRLIDTKQEPGVEVEAGKMKLHVCRCAMETDFLINVPVLKGHCQTKMTCALKNMKGLIPDTEKRRFHRLGLHQPIACLNAALHQDFILVDDICGDPDFEEGGNPWERHMLLAGTDPVLMDCYAAWELGYAATDIPYITMAADLGAGCLCQKQLPVKDISVVSQRENERATGRFEFKPRRRDQAYLDVAYAVEDADTCSACYASLTEALYRLKEEGIILRLGDKLSIGQGMREKTGKYGIGACTKHFINSVPGCPPDPDRIYETLKSWIKAEEQCERKQASDA